MVVLSISVTEQQTTFTSILFFVEIFSFSFSIIYMFENHPLQLLNKHHYPILPTHF